MCYLATRESPANATILVILCVRCTIMKDTRMSQIGRSVINVLEGRLLVMIQWLLFMAQVIAPSSMTLAYSEILTEQPPVK